MRSDIIDDEIISFLSLEGPADQTALSLEKILSEWSLAYPAGPLGSFLSVNMKIKGLNAHDREFLGILAASVDCWGGFNYHSAQHHLEVFIIAMALSRNDRHLRPLLAIAAVAHDYEYHPDEAAIAVPFRQELRSAEFVTSMMDIMYCQESPTPEAVRTVILSTYPGARKALKAGYGAWRDRLKDGNPGVKMDFSRDVYRASCLLADADIADSIGLSGPWSRMKAALLAYEQGVAFMRPEDTIGFFEHVVGDAFLTDEAEALFGHNLRRNSQEAITAARAALVEKSRRDAAMQRAADRTEIVT